MLTGEQLQLALNDVRLSLGHEEPWGGRSPRDLTRGGLVRIFKAQAEKSVSDFVSCDQFSLRLVYQKSGPLYEGAAPLLPLPWEVDDE